MESSSDRGTKRSSPISTAFIFCFGLHGFVPYLFSQRIPSELQYATSLESVILTGNEFVNNSECKALLWGPTRVGRLDLPRAALRRIRILQVDAD